MCADKNERLPLGMLLPEEILSSEEKKKKGLSTFNQIGKKEGKASTEINREKLKTI